MYKYCIQLFKKSLSTLNIWRIIYPTIYTLFIQWKMIDQGLMLFFLELIKKDESYKSYVKRDLPEGEFLINTNKYIWCMG